MSNLPNKDDLTRLYGKLRASILSRHFAINRYFRSNVLKVDSTLDSTVVSTYNSAEELLSKDPATQIVERWKIDYKNELFAGDDNPLFHSGLLLTCLAVECYLGVSTH